MSSEVVLRAEHLTKVYRIRHGSTKHATLTEATVERVRHPLRRARTEIFRALQDVNFEVRAGEVLGIVGRNGAGKSTLLKVLTRITVPTEGEVEIFGRVGSLLEVGTGFHPELTGKENVYLNGAILGMGRREIDRRYDEIVEFAGVERFLDTPVKRYSSGMYVRLAFAVAAHLDTDILIIDEVLAVGDAEFQKRCLGKMTDAASAGRTVIFVSHQMHAVSSLCTKAMHLERGEVSFFGDVADAVTHYIEQAPSRREREADPEARSGSGELRVLSVTTNKTLYHCEEFKEVRLRIERRRPTPDKIYVCVWIYDEAGRIVTQCDSRLTKQWFEVNTKVDVNMILRSPWLQPGRYNLGVGIGAFGVSQNVDEIFEACEFEVLPILPYKGAAEDWAVSLGLVLGDFEFRESVVDGAARPASSTSAPASWSR